MEGTDEMEDKRTIEITKSQAPAGAQTSGVQSVQPSPFGLLRREIDRLFDDFGLYPFSIIAFLSDDQPLSRARPDPPMGWRFRHHSGDGPFGT